MTIYNDSDATIEILAVVPGDPGVPESGALLRIALAPGQAWSPGADLQEVMIPVTHLKADVMICKSITEGVYGKEDGTKH